MKTSFFFIYFLSSVLFAEEDADLNLEQELYKHFSMEKHQAQTEGKTRSLKNLKELEVSLSDLYPELEDEDQLQMDEEKIAGPIPEEEAMGNNASGFEGEVLEKEKSMPKKCHQQFLLKTTKESSSNQSKENVASHADSK